MSSVGSRICGPETFVEKQELDSLELALDTDQKSHGILQNSKICFLLHPVSRGARCLVRGHTGPYFTMNQKIKLHHPIGHPIARYLLLGAASMLSSQAAVTINSSFNLDSGTNLYTYTYSIENSGPQVLALISIPGNATANIAGVLTPTGFSLNFDAFQGFISFTEDNDVTTDQSFAVGLTISPFQFTSPLAPGTVTFTAFDIEGTEFTGSTIAPIPEPSSMLLVSLALFQVTTRRRR